MLTTVSVLEKPQSFIIQNQKDCRFVCLSEPKTHISGRKDANRKKPRAGPGHPAADGATVGKGGEEGVMRSVREEQTNFSSTICQ